VAVSAPQKAGVRLAPAATGRQRPTRAREMRIRMFISVLVQVLLVIIPPWAIIMGGQLASQEYLKNAKLSLQSPPGLR
jgi:hypothetical protein